MFDTRCSIYRPEGTLLLDVKGRPALHIAVQIDRMSNDEMVAAKSMWEWHGKYTVKIITYGTLARFAFQREDVFIDEINIDPDSPSGAGYRYVVYDQPKRYIDHQLVVAEYIVGR